MQVVYFVPAGSSAEAQAGMVMATLAAFARASPLFSRKSAAAAHPASAAVAISDAAGMLTFEVVNARKHHARDAALPINPR